MKVSQLIKKLQKLDGDLSVVSDHSGTTLVSVVVSADEFDDENKVWLGFDYE